MDFWLSFLPIIIYVLLIVILIVGIIFGIKMINTIDKVEKVVDDVSEKVSSFNGFFSLIDLATDKVAALSDKFVSIVGDFFAKKLFKKKKRNYEEELEDE